MLKLEEEVTSEVEEVVSEEETTEEEVVSEEETSEDEVVVEYNVEEDVEALLQGEELSEEFREKLRPFSKLLSTLSSKKSRPLWKNSMLLHLQKKLKKSKSL